jgi:uncharacterized protein YneF (UPF0154 family)
VLREEDDMNERRISVVLAGLLISAFLGCVAGWSSEDKTPRMTKEELRLLMGDQGVVVVNVRIQEEWKKSDRKIQGANHEDPEKDVTKWADKYPRDKTLVFYCS